MSPSCDQLDEIRDDIRRNHYTTLPIGVKSLLSNYINHTDSKRLAEHSPQIAELPMTHPYAGDGVDQWAENYTTATCRGAAESLLFASRKEDCAASATNAKSARLDVVKGWSLCNTTHHLKQHGALLRQVLEDVVKQPGVELNLDKAIGLQAGETDQAPGNVNGQVDGEYKAIYKYNSGTQSRSASILTVVSGSSSLERV
jgi:hypothetical protein